MSDEEITQKLAEMAAKWNNAAAESLAVALDALHRVEALEARIEVFNRHNPHKI